MLRHITFAIILIFTMNFMVRAQSFLRQTEWNVAELKQWAENNKNSPWKGCLLYQGSDTLHHYFISRVMDEFVWFNVSREQLKMNDEIPYKNLTSNNPLGYYYVDPLNDFKIVETSGSR